MSSSLSILGQAVLATLSYCDQFAFPLTTTEVWQRLIWPVGQSTENVSKKTVRQMLQRLENQGILEQKASHWVLKNQSDIVQIRRARHEVFLEKQPQLLPILRFALKWPWISAIFVTGSLAMQHSLAEDDIDLLIITPPRRLWLTRFAFLLYAEWCGRRRSWQKETPGSWCLNLWLDTDHMPVLPQKRSLYTAYEVMQAQPIFSRGGVAELFQTQNAWILDWLPNSAAERETGVWPDVKVGDVIQGWQVKGKPLWDWAMSMLEFLAWRTEYWYMQKHRTSEQVAPGFAFFHPRDTVGWIYRRWQTSLEAVVPKRVAVKIIESYVAPSRSSET